MSHDENAPRESDRPRSRRPSMDGPRLCAAADAAMAAALKIQADTGARVVDLVGVVGTPGAPENLAGYTKDEVREACEFLARLGYITRANRASA